MKLLEVYYNNDSLVKEYPLLEIPHGIELFSLHLYHKIGLQHYTFAYPKQARQWCGDKLTRKDNETISNL